MDEPCCHLLSEMIAGRGWIDPYVAQPSELLAGFDPANDNADGLSLLCVRKRDPHPNEISELLHPLFEIRPIQITLLSESTFSHLTDNRHPLN